MTHSVKPSPQRPPRRVKQDNRKTGATQRGKKHRKCRFCLEAAWGIPTHSAERGERKSKCGRGIGGSSAGEHHRTKRRRRQSEALLYGTVLRAACIFHTSSHERRGFPSLNVWSKFKKSLPQGVLPEQNYFQHHHHHHHYTSILFIIYQHTLYE